MLDSLSPPDLAFVRCAALIEFTVDFFSNTKLALNKPARWSETETTGCRIKRVLAAQFCASGCASNSICLFTSPI